VQRKWIQARRTPLIDWLNKCAMEETFGPSQFVYLYFRWVVLPACGSRRGIVGSSAPPVLQVAGRRPPVNTDCPTHTWRPGGALRITQHMCRQFTQLRSLAMFTSPILCSYSPKLLPEIFELSWKVANVAKVSKISKFAKVGQNLTKSTKSPKLPKSTKWAKIS
jgi:hypothetical protein